jgi:predicted enzyme related to lactoylglutathione lyase
MPTRTSTPAGLPCWIDLLTSDKLRAKEFYGRLLGWSSTDAGEEFGHYSSFLHDDQVVAGLMGNTPDSGSSDGWTTYLASDDAQATVDAVRAAGGAVALEPMDVMGLGHMAVVVDPGGATVGIWQAGTHPGFATAEEPGAPSWHELHTRDYAASIRFYEQAFGWTTRTESDADDFRYTTCVDDDGQLRAGIMDASVYAPEGTPAHWAVYVGVSDCVAAVELVRELGGGVVHGPDDSPYGLLAVVTDPTGAELRLVQDPTG